MILVFFWSQCPYPVEVHVENEAVRDVGPDVSKQAATTDN